MPHTGYCSSNVVEEWPTMLCFVSLVIHMVILKSSGTLRRQGLGRGLQAFVVISPEKKNACNSHRIPSSYGRDCCKKFLRSLWPHVHALTHIPTEMSSPWCDIPRGQPSCWTSSLQKSKLNKPHFLYKYLCFGYFVIATVKKYNIQVKAGLCTLK